MNTTIFKVFWVVLILYGFVPLAFWYNSVLPHNLNLFALPSWRESKNPYKSMEGLGTRISISTKDTSVKSLFLYNKDHFLLIFIEMKKFLIQLALVCTVQCCASVLTLEYFYPEYLLSLLNRSYIRSSVNMSLLLNSSILLSNTRPSPGDSTATMSIQRYYQFKQIVYLPH